MTWKTTSLLLFQICVLGAQGFSTHSHVRSVTWLPPATAATVKQSPTVFGGHHYETSTSLAIAPEVEMAAISAQASSPLMGFLRSPELWTSLLMASIVLLLYIWEEGEKIARKKLPETLRPILDSMLSEMGALGFIGLFLGIVVIHGPLGSLVDTVSEEFFDDKHLLLELFENLHDEFFVAAIAFFIVNGITVWRTLVKIETIQEVSSAVFDINGDGDVGLDELASFLNVDSLVVDADGDGILDDDEIKDALRNAKPPSIWDEVFASADRVRAEALVVRERFIQTCRVGPSFCIEDYFIPIFGHNLEEIVELAPTAYFLFIPWVALSQAVDIPRHVVSLQAPNAASSCGIFMETPVFFWTSTISAIIILYWGAWNFLKITQIKEMLAPTLVRDSNNAGGEVLLPPRYEDADLLREYEERGQPGIVKFIEGFYAKPATNDHERLFGVVGAAGPEFYRNSIKFHTWLVTAQIVFWGPQIVLRDIQALTNGWEVGNPDLLIPELVIYGTFVTLAALQLVFAPQAFLTFCLVTSIEQLVEEKTVQELCVLNGFYDEDEEEKSPASVLEPVEPQLAAVGDAEVVPIEAQTGFRSKIKKIFGGDSS